MGIVIAPVPNAWTLRINKADDEDRSSDTTLSEDAELAFAVGANQAWTAQIVVHVQSASNTPDIQCSIVAPSGTTGAAAWRGLYAGATTVNNQMHASTQLDFTTAYATGFAAINDGIPIMCTLNIQTTAAGSVALYWAQLSSNAAATTVRAGSFMAARRWS